MPPSFGLDGHSCPPVRKRESSFRRQEKWCELGVSEINIGQAWLTTSKEDSLHGGEPFGTCSEP